MESDLTPIGAYNFRNQHKVFGIKIDDRRRHIYVVGKTGVGKSTLLENMIIADIRSGKGVGIVDPHGELAEKILDFVPEERLDDVIYFDPSDMDYPIAFNPMEQVGNEFRHLVASGIMGVFKKIWPDAWSARMEYILNNTLLALLELPDATLLGILRMFAEPEYRKKIVENLKDPVIKAFWQNEFARYSQKLETEALAAIQNKVGQFVSNPLIRNILGQPRSALNMRQIMDTGKIFIVNLSKGKIGEDNSALLGAMIITRLNLAAMSRVDIAERDRRDFFLYVDEFQNFATDSFANILSEARKYHLSLTLAHQYIGQLTTSDSTKVRDAIFGNVGTIISFRVGADDAEFLEKEFMPEFLQTDLVNLGKANIYIKLMIDGIASRPFSAETIAPQQTPLNSYKDVIIKNSREKYGTPKAVVESRIAGEWLARSDAAIGEKIERSGERRLSEVLRPAPGQRPPYQPGRGATTGVNATSGFAPNSAPRSSSFSRLPASPAPLPSPASRTPRRMEDVQRQDAEEMQSAPPPVVQNNSRPEDRPVAAKPVETRPAPVSPPPIERPEQPREASRAVSSLSETLRGVAERSSASTDRPRENPVHGTETAPVARVAPAAPPEKTETAAPRLRSEDRAEPPSRLEPAEKTARPSGLSLSALRDGGAGVRKEDVGKSALNTEEHQGQTAADESVPAQRKPVKLNVDIEGLRRAINESLRKQNETGASVRAEAKVGGDIVKPKTFPVAPRPIEEQRASVEAVKSEIKRVTADRIEASPKRTVRLNVPAHDDLAAKRQVAQELSRMDAEGEMDVSGRGFSEKKDLSGHANGGEGQGADQNEEHDTRSIREARERINRSLSRQNFGVRHEKTTADVNARPREARISAPPQDAIRKTDQVQPVSPARQSNAGFIGPTLKVPPRSVRGKSSSKNGPDVITSG